MNLTHPAFADWGAAWIQFQQLRAAMKKQGRLPRPAFDARTRQLYSARWSHFCEFCAHQQLSPTSITSESISNFLLSRTVRSVSRPGLPSEVTQRRYGNLLIGVLSHAQVMGWLEPNRNLVLIPASEHRFHEESAVISPALFATVVQQIDYAPDDFYACKESLVLQLVCREGFTVQEVCGLKRDFFSGDDASWDGTLQLFGPRKAQNRAVIVLPETRLLVHKWLSLCEGLPASELLLRSRPKQKKMSTIAVYLICARALRRATEVVNGGELPQHIGPNMLRNACLVAWLSQGMTKEWVAERAGLSRADLLARLEHLTNTRPSRSLE